MKEQKYYICPNEKKWTIYRHNGKMDFKEFGKIDLYTCTKCNFTFSKKTLEARLDEYDMNNVHGKILNNTIGKVK